MQRAGAAFEFAVAVAHWWDRLENASGWIAVSLVAFAVSYVWCRMLMAGSI